MGAIHSWIAPILVQALDDHFDAADSNTLHVEDDLSNLHIHCDSIEFVQLVEWQSTAAELTATVADGETSIRAVFAQIPSSQSVQCFSTFSLPDLKPGAVFRLDHPEIRISGCFDPARVVIRIKDFNILHNGSDRQPPRQLVDVSTLPAVTDRLRRFINYRVSEMMARRVFNSAVGGSPGLKSQNSAEEDSDLENSGDRFLSQTDFATQLPFSPPKSSDTRSPPKPKLLGNRKVMGDLRQLVNVMDRAPKNAEPCIDDKRLMNVESRNEQTEVEQREAMAVTIKSAAKSNVPPIMADVRGSTSELGRPPEQKIVKLGLDPVEDGTTGGQNPQVDRTSITISDGNVHQPGDRLDTLSRWRNGMKKPTYLPRYLQTISKAQTDLLASHDSWQPALVGRPCRPGTLPLELLNKLTAVVDENAALINVLPRSDQQVLGSPLAIPQGEVYTADEDPDLPSNSPTRKLFDQTRNQSPLGGQETISEPDETDVEWSQSPPRPSPRPRQLPPDSSPVASPPKMSVPSPSVEGAYLRTSQAREQAPSTPLHHHRVRDLEESSQAAPDNSNRKDCSSMADLINMKTSSTLHGKPASPSSNTPVAAPSSLREGDQVLASESESHPVEISTSQSAQIPAINSSDPTTDMEVNINNVIQVSHTPFTPRLPTSSAPQPELRQIEKRSPSSLQRQPANQKLTSHSSTQLIPGTFLLETVGPHLAGSLNDLRRPEESIEDFEINTSEDGSMPSANPAKPSSESHNDDERTDEYQQGTSMIQRASQAIPITTEDPRKEHDGAVVTGSTCSHTSVGLTSKERNLAALGSKAGLKRQANKMDHGGLSRHSKRAKPTAASSVSEVSSDESGFQKVDNMTKQYRREVIAKSRKLESVSSLQPLNILPSNASPHAASVLSSSRRHSAQTSLPRQIKSSTPLTSMSAQAPKVLREDSVSTSDTSRRNLLQPEDQFLIFKHMYPTYEGNITQFLTTCRMIKTIRSTGKMLPKGVWDDFVYRHHHDYRSHLRELAQSDKLESPVPYEEYYAEYVSEPVHLKGVLRVAFIDALSMEESQAAFGSPLARPPSQSDRPEIHQYSVAASSSASNICAKESLADRLDRMASNNVTMTLESQLLLREQDEALQSQSSVDLWLQRASGVASPELGTPGRLATEGGTPHLHLAENKDFTTSDPPSEMQAVTILPTNNRNSTSEVSVQNERSSNAITEPFRTPTLNDAKHTVSQHGRSQVQTDAKGASRPGVKRTSLGVKNFFRPGRS